MSEPKVPQPQTVIKIIGVGGAGGNAVSHMASSGLSAFEFICANTDAQALASTQTEKRIQLGESGLGAGSDPIVGRESAMHERSAIADALKGADMVFITAGEGGGTDDVTTQRDAVVHARNTGENFAIGNEGRVDTYRHPACLEVATDYR